MKLLTQQLRRRLPPLYAQENTKDPEAIKLRLWHGSAAFGAAAN